MNEAMKSFMDSLTGAQRKKAEKCTNEKEFLSFLEEEGIQLSEEMLKLVGGGFYFGKQDSSTGEFTGGTGPTPKSTRLA